MVNWPGTSCPSTCFLINTLTSTHPITHSINPPPYQPPIFSYHQVNWPGTSCPNTCFLGTTRSSTATSPICGGCAINWHRCWWILGRLLTSGASTSIHSVDTLPRCIKRARLENPHFSTSMDSFISSCISRYQWHPSNEGLIDWLIDWLND